MSFFSIPPDSYALLAAVLGILIADGLDLDEQNSLGNFLQELSQAILTVNAQQQLLQSQNDNDLIQQQIDLLKKQIELLECKINNKR